MLKGRATEQATKRFAAGQERLRHNSFYRESQHLTLSTVGLGTYLGEKSENANKSYTEAILAAISGGINVIDTSLNYRNQRSEKAISEAILRLDQTAKRIGRDELVICSKAGYLVRGATPEELRPEDIVGKMHSMAPVFLADQLERSRANLGLETIDVFYLHNPETQFGFVSQDEFYNRLRPAFTFLENAVSEGKIQYYGAATWEGFRKPHALSLARMESVAKETAGPDHHFRFIQLPYNITMPEAFVSHHESFNGAPCTVLELASDLGITVVASASILQARLSKELPERIQQSIGGFSTDAQRAIQFSRSAPGITTSLVGIGRVEHVEENLGLGAIPPLASEQYLDLFRIGV